MTIQKLYTLLLVEKEKNNIATTLKLIYRESDVSTLEALLMNSSIADFLNRIKYLEDYLFLTNYYECGGEDNSNN